MRHHRLARLLLAAGSTDMVYSKQVLDIAAHILKLLTYPNMKVNSPHGRIYDISEAFPHGTPIRLAFAPPHAIAGYNAAVGTVSGITSIILATPGQFYLVDTERLVEFVKSPQMWSSFLHEIAHFVRSQVQQVVQQDNPPRQGTYEEWVQKYHQSPPEIDAHFMQFLTPLVEQYEKLTTMDVQVLQGDYQGKGPKRNSPGLSKLKEARLKVFGKSPREMWSKFVAERPMVMKHAPMDVKRRWIRRITQFYDHLLQVEAQLRRKRRRTTIRTKLLRGGV